MAQTQATQARSTRWTLEIARGLNVGKVFDVLAGETILGNGVEGPGGIDLRDQEVGSPRRMAARQASLEVKGADILIRDLDSPGGTFVNRQRLLSGQARRLQAGDEIQLGGVVLRVAARGDAGQSLPTEMSQPQAQPPPPPGGRLPVPYTIDGGVACRTWDDFLVLAAQRWSDLLHELASGRLADYLRRIQRTDLLPDPPSRERERAVNPHPGPPPLPDGRGSDPGVGAPAILDEQLDRWLARIPVSTSSAPELDVHPASLEARAAGGTTRHLLRVANVGYRLLRGTARVEPAGSGCVRIVPPYDSRPFQAIEEARLAVELTAPEDPRGPLDAAIVIESNGGTRRIPIRIGAPEKPPSLPEAADASPGPALSELFRPISTAVGTTPPPTRFVAGILGALAVRSFVFASTLLPFGARGSSVAEPRLPALAVLCAALGFIAGLIQGGRRTDRGPLDAAMSGTTAGLFGIMAAAVLYALVRTIERPLGDWASSAWAVGLLWAAIGAAAAGFTLLIPLSRGDAK